MHEEPHPFTAVSLDAALDQAIGLLDGASSDSGARIEREPLPMVIGERGQLAQVFQNLLSNAMKYRRAGEAPVVRVWAEGSVSEWLISVQDNGIGFDPIYGERIFGLFKRLHRDAYPGTGVGLGICRRIVERHGGRIWAESDGEGRGATFRFTLRAVDMDPAGTKLLCFSVPTRLLRSPRESLGTRTYRAGSRSERSG